MGGRGEQGEEIAARRSDQKVGRGLAEWAEGRGEAGNERETGASVARQKGERGRMRRRGGRGGKKTPRVERGQEGGGKGVKAGREGVRERAGSAGENDGKGRRRRWRETAWSGPDGRGGPALHDGAGELVGGEM